MEVAAVVWKDLAQTFASSSYICRDTHFPIYFLYPFCFALWRSLSILDFSLFVCLFYFVRVLLPHSIFRTSLSLSHDSARRQINGSGKRRSWRRGSRQRRHVIYIRFRFLPIFATPFTLHLLFQPTILIEKKSLFFSSSYFPGGGIQRFKTSTKSDRK